MSEKKKYSKTDLDDFLRYRGDNLSDSERHGFERELQKDPFASEAEEGFSSVEPAAIRSDIDNLRNRLKARTRRSSSFAIYRVAASVALLMILTTLFFVIRRPSAEDQTREAEVVVSEAAPEKANAGAPPPATQPEAGPAGTAPAAPEKPEQPQIAKSEKSKGVEDISVPGQAAETIKVPVMMQEINIAAADMAEKAEPARIAVAVAEEEMIIRQVRGRVISSEDNLPVPGASVVLKGTTIGAVTDTGGNFKITLPVRSDQTLVASFIGMETKEINIASDSLVDVRLDPSAMALQEVVVAGYGTKKDRISETGAVSRVDPGREAAYREVTAAEPVSGWESFNRYIEEHIRKPEPPEGVQRVVVVISFKVTVSGRIEEIKAIRSPGEQFTEEAIRLIKEGPAWKPATENGSPVNEEVRVRISFRF